MSLFIHGGRVLRGKSQTPERADIWIDGDRISAVDKQLPVPEGAERIDAAGHFVLPGLVNAHTHAHNNYMKGSADNWTLEDLLNHGAALNSNRTVEDHYLSAAIGAVEMLKTGCTSAYDLFMAIPVPTEEGIEAVVQAYRDVGLRAVVAPAVADVVFYRTIPGFIDLLPPDLRQAVEKIQPPSAEALLQLTEAGIRKWNGIDNDRIRVGVAPTIPGQCSDAFLLGGLRLMREYGVGIHTHLVETKIQALYGWQRWGKSVTAHLHEMGLLGPKFVGAHGVWLTPEDIQRLADTGSCIAHNPASNLKLGSGIAPIKELLDSGVKVGLGCDGSMSSDNQNLFESMRFAAMVGKIRFPHRVNRWIGAQDVWNMVTRGSAGVLGMEEEIGIIEVGRKADLILMKDDSVFLKPLNNFINALNYAEAGTDVDTVLVDGKVVMKNGRVITVDEERLRARAQERIEKLNQGNAASWSVAEQLSPFIAEACQKVVAMPFSINRYAGPIESKP